MVIPGIYNSTCTTLVQRAIIKVPTTINISYPRNTHYSSLILLSPFLLLYFLLLSLPFTLPYLTSFFLLLLLLLLLLSSSFSSSSSSSSFLSPLIHHAPTGTVLIPEPFIAVQVLFIYTWYVRTIKINTTRSVFLL